MQTVFNHASALSTLPRAWCVFSHFDPNGRVEPYVLQYLSELNRCGLGVVVVSTSRQLDDASIDALKRVASVAILRDNVGYDFGSYKVGIDLLREQGIEPRQLLLTNDSVFGPFHSLNQVFTDAQSYDLYGMTDSFDFHYHLQSFFIIYGERVLKSQDFWNFWDQVEFIDANEPGFKQQIILRYEVGGSQYFLEKGFRIGSAYPFTAVLSRAFDDYLNQLRSIQDVPGSSIRPLHIQFNATHRFWNTLLDIGFPFLKRELLLVNPTNADISKWSDMVRSQSDYDLTMIISAMRNYSGSDDFFFITNSATIARLLDDEGNVTLTIDPAFRPWQEQFKVPETRRFRFDEQIYLDKCPDVKVAFMNGKVTSALRHFRNTGYREGRPVALVRAAD